MSKFFGKIGYATCENTAPGVWKESQITEREYFGDVTRHSMRWESGESINDNLLINNEFSIVADPFAYENFSSMKYIEYMGTRWKISSIEVSRPRLIITIGGVWNGDSSETSGEAGEFTWNG